MIMVRDVMHLIGSSVVVVEVVLVLVVDVVDCKIEMAITRKKAC